MVVYYYISLLHGYMVYISITILYFFTPCQSTSSDRRSPFNHLWNEPKAFLVAVPDSNALAVIPILLVLHVRGLLLLLPLLHLLIDPNDTFFKRKRRGGDSNPWRRKQTYTWRISPQDHGAPHKILSYKIASFYSEIVSAFPNQYS